MYLLEIIPLHPFFFGCESALWIRALNLLSCLLHRACLYLQCCILPVPIRHCLTDWPDSTGTLTVGEKDNLETLLVDWPLMAKGQTPNVHNWQEESMWNWLCVFICGHVYVLPLRGNCSDRITRYTHVGFFFFIVSHGHRDVVLFSLSIKCTDLWNGITARCSKSSVKRIVWST